MCRLLSNALWGLMLRAVAIACWLLFAVVPLDGIAGEPAATRIVHRDKVVHFFGGQKVTTQLDIQASQALSGRLSWQLSAGGRRIAARDVPVDSRPDRLATVAVDAALPPVKDGVAIPLELRALLFSGDESPIAEWKETLWVLADDPFADRRQWLAALKLHLFDPPGATAAALDELKIPFTRVRNLASLPELAPGLLIVGEDAAWAAQRDLAPLVLELSAKGTPVLCLAPAAGALPLPLIAADESSPPLEVSFRRRDILGALDPRLDAEAWVAGQPLATRGLAVVLERGELVGRFVEPGNGWPWLQLKHAPPGANLIWCGWPVVRDWDRSPAPRYLLARMLEVLTAKRPSSSAPNP